MSLLLLTAGWLVVTGLYARSELLAARHDLEAMRSAMAGEQATAGGHRGERAEAAAESAADHAAQAYGATTGPAWYLAARLPFVGAPLETVRGTTRAIDRLTGDVLPSVVGTVSRLSGHGGSGRLDLAALRGSAPALEQAARHMARARAEAHGLPRRTWLPAVDRVRGVLVDRLDRLAPAVADAATGARLLPPMLGNTAPRRYLLVFQNTAEARGTGGLPGAFAVVTADQGHMRFETFGNNTMLENVKPKVDLGAEFTGRYGAYDPTGTWANTNLSPHFPYAARIWAATWRAYGGKPVDGVAAVDPSALALLLRATGPGVLPDGTLLTSDNVLDLTERTGYARYADTTRRKAFFLDVARSAATRLTAALDDPQRLPALLASVHEVVKQERLKLWSTRPDEQSLVEARPLGGVLPSGEGPFAGLVVNNAAGGKLDYYLDRRLEWIPGRCTPEGRLVTAKISLGNRAPVTGLPSYVTLRADKPTYPTRPGDNRLMVSYYASAGAELTGATLDGAPAMTGSSVEHGHPVYSVDLELPAQRTRTLTLHMVEPASDRGPVLLRQQLVAPLRTVVRPLPACQS
ncbi:DUF4012 domain-containing protein [Streptomyces sp. NPDC019396]|uniref:DUF4012 domain-containing protein n=1 Tax=Streptomyces sp. NPDC019396 TaxID=3154687 RepID=UPI0033E0FE5E